MRRLTPGDWVEIVLAVAVFAAAVAMIVTSQGCITIHRVEVLPNVHYSASQPTTQPSRDWGAALPQEWFK